MLHNSSSVKRGHRCPSREVRKLVEVVSLAYVYETPRIWQHHQFANPSPFEPINLLRKPRAIALQMSKKSHPDQRNARAGDGPQNSYKRLGKKKTRRYATIE